jgi:hypothetical protein
MFRTKAVAVVRLFPVPQESNIFCLSRNCPACRSAVFQLTHSPLLKIYVHDRLVSNPMPGLIPAANSLKTSAARFKRKDSL